MIVAIAGGTGFIGRHLVLKHIAAGDTVRVLTRKDLNSVALPDTVQLYRGDFIGNLKDLISFVDGADILYNCAYEIRNENRMQTVHIQGTKSLINAATQRIGRWVQLSSVGAYGFHSKGIVTEQTPLNPVGTYETTKTESDRLIIEAGSRGDIAFSILRPSNVFGYDMPNQSLFQMIRAIDKGFLFFIGKPGASANYIHVNNVVKALMECGKNFAALNQIYNLSDWCTLEEFVSTISQLIGKPTPRLRLPEPIIRSLVFLTSGLPQIPLNESRVNALTTRCIYSNEKIERDLGYVHTIDMKNGLRELVEAWDKKI